MRIEDPALFIRDIVGTDGKFGVDDISSQLRNIIISRFSDIIANANIPIMDLASNYHQLSQYITEKLKDEFSRYGIELTLFLIENISVPQAVEEAIDKRTQMGIVTDLHKYLEFQTAESMTSATGNSTAAMGASMGVGFAMADKLSKNFGEPKGYVPAPFERMYYYAKDKEPVGPLNIDEIETLIKEHTIDSQSLMWSSGMEHWQKAKTFEEIEALFNLLSPPPLS
jgi:hypothetical protein